MKGILLTALVLCATAVDLELLDLSYADLPTFESKIKPEQYESDWFTNNMLKFKDYTYEMKEASEFLTQIKTATSFDMMQNSERFRRKIPFIRNIIEYLKTHIDTKTKGYMSDVTDSINYFRNNLESAEKKEVMEQWRKDKTMAHVLKFYQEFSTDTSYLDLMRAFFEIAEKIDNFDPADLDNVLELLRELEFMNRITFDHLVGFWRNDDCSLIRELKEPRHARQVELVKGYLEALGFSVKCQAVPQQVKNVLGAITEVEHVFVDKVTKAALVKLNRHPVQMEHLLNLIAFGCGDVGMDLSSVLDSIVAMEKPESREFMVSAKQEAAKLPSTKPVTLTNAEFDSTFEMFGKYQRLTTDEQTQVLNVLQANKRYGPLMYLKKMSKDGLMTQLPLIVEDVSNCTSRKLTDVLELVGLFKDIESAEAFQTITALFEVRNCNVIYPLKVDRQKVAVDKAVDLLEKAFGLVSCKNELKTPAKTSTGLPWRSQRLVDNLKNEPISKYIIRALGRSKGNRNSTITLKQSHVLSEGCTDLLEHTKEVGDILNDMPKNLVFMASKNKYQRQAQQVNRAVAIMDEFDLYMTLAAQEDIIQYLRDNGQDEEVQKLQQLTSHRYALRDLQVMLTRMGSCPEIDNFIRVVEVWKHELDSEEAKERVVRMLEVSNCDVVGKVAKGEEVVEKVVKMLDEHFGTNSCLAKEAHAKLLMTRRRPSNRN